MPRAHHFTRKQRRALEDRAEGKCEKCHAVLKPGEGDADHVIPVEMGGESELWNGQWLCRTCHKGKTALDVRMIRKAQAVGDKHRGVIRKKGFQSPYRKKMNGDVVDRRTGELVSR